MGITVVKAGLTLRPRMQQIPQKKNNNLENNDIKIVNTFANEIQW